MTDSSPSWVSIATRVLVIALAASIGLSLLVGIFGFITLNESESFGRLMWGLVVLSVCCGSLLAATVPLRRSRFVVLMCVSMLATILGAGILLAMIAGAQRDLDDSQQNLAKLAVTLLIVGLTTAHNGALGVIAMPSRVLGAVRIAVMTCVWAAAGLPTLILWTPRLVEHSLGDVFLFLGLMAVLILGSIAGTIAVPIAAISRANKDILPVESIGSRVSLLLDCPKCHEQQKLRAGNFRCGKCGAGLFIEIEEPRCECGYLLYQLQGDTCPECGRAIPEAQRWRGGPEAEKV